MNGWKIVWSEYGWYVMVICCRKGCKENIVFISYEYGVRFCYIYFNRWKELSWKRNVKKDICCKVCGVNFFEMRNNKFCLNKCKGIGMRIFKDFDKIEIYNYLYWFNIEGFIKNNLL